MKAMQKAKVNLKSQAYDHIRRQILGGQLGDGDIFSPRQIAKGIGMSYTPVREAVLQLQTEGLLEKIGNRGVCVRSLAIDELETAFELRLVMETGAAELGATRITDSALAELRTNLRRHSVILKELRRAGRHQPITETYYDQVDDQILVLNFEFHLILLNAVGNAQLIKNIGDLRVLTRAVGLRVHFPDQNCLAQYIRDFSFHAKIFRAMRRRDGEAARLAVKYHLQNAYQHNLRIHKAIQATLSSSRAGKRYYTPSLLASMQEIENRLAASNSSSERS